MKKLLFCLLIATALTCSSCNSGNTSTKSDDSTTNATSSSTNNNNSEEDREKRNEQVVLSFFDDFNKKDINGAFQYCATNFTDYGDPTTPKPMPLDSSKAMLNTWMTAFPDFSVQNPKAVADGDTVMVWSTNAGTWKGDLMGHKATGKSFKFQDVDIFILNDDGKITEHHNIQPFSTIAQQIGLKM